MRKYTTWAVLAFVVLLVGFQNPIVPNSLRTTTQAQAPGEKYAVLISTGQTTIDDQAYHSEYWYDLVLTYRMLVENGFTHDHIYVLYGNGTDFTSTNAFYQNPYSNSITDYAVSRNSIRDIFDWLANGSMAEGISALTTNDFLFIWWMGHGGCVGNCTDCNSNFSVSTTGESVDDDEIDSWTSGISFRRRALVWMTCHSGGLVNDLQGNTTVIETSCACTEGAQSRTYDVIHAEWTYLVDVALLELEPAGTAVTSDADNNVLVSAQETFDWASNEPMSSTPQLSDDGGIAPCMFIRLAEPTKDIQIYIRDHENDAGTVPSYQQVWYEGPDVWVRHNQDGQTDHQDPVYPYTNYVYANVHNVGCADANNITVDFYWVPSTGWSNMGLWSLIDTATVPALPVLGTDTVNVEWTSVPIPGEYCINVVLNVTDDAANSDGHAYMDNNKAIHNLTVKNSFSSMKQFWTFFIQNGGEDLIPIELVFYPLDIHPDSVIRVELPPDLPFGEIVGAEVFEDENGWTILEIGDEPARVLGVELEPGDRRRAILTVTLPKSLEPGEYGAVAFEEYVDEQIQGGIRFVSLASAPDVVMCNQLRDRGNVLGGLGEVYGIQAASEISKLYLGLVESGDCTAEDAYLEATTASLELSSMLSDVLRESIPEYGDRYSRALEMLELAVEQHNLVSVLEAQQEMLLYESVSLANALAK